MFTVTELRPAQRVESNESEPTPYPGATDCPQQAATSAEPSQRPYSASLGVAETTLRSTARRTRPTTEVGAPPGIQSMEWALQGIKHRRKSLPTEADRTSLTELSCSSELQQCGNGSLWSSPTHLQPWKSSRRTTPGSWRLPASALAGPNTEPNTNISLELTLSLRVISPRAASPPHRPEDRYFKKTPLMSFTLPFSTSSRAGPPTRASKPASFRLHRWSGLDGLLPARPCRPVSSGGTPGVARAATTNPALFSQRRTFSHFPIRHPCFLSLVHSPCGAYPKLRLAARPRSARSEDVN